LQRIETEELGHYKISRLQNYKIKKYKTRNKIYFGIR
jgi:hypothetical protein